MAEESKKPVNPVVPSKPAKIVENAKKPPISKRRDTPKATKK